MGGKKSLFGGFSAPGHPAISNRTVDRQQVINAGDGGDHQDDVACDGQRTISRGVRENCFTGAKSQMRRNPNAGNFQRYKFYWKTKV